MYEGGAVDARDEIRFARFTEDWLTPRRGPDPTTPDLASASARGASCSAARAGRTACSARALEFDGADDAVRLPYSGRLPLGTKDFTASLWFRYTATSGEQPLLWMGGVGTTQPQVWLRGEPASRPCPGLITVRDGASAPPVRLGVARVAPTTTGSGTIWRCGAAEAQLTLFIDGTPVSTADAAGIRQP